jgi:hypothetical protein
MTREREILFVLVLVVGAMLLVGIIVFGMAMISFFSQ